MTNDPSNTDHLLERLRSGDRQALTDLFQRHRNRLRRMVELRIDAKLQGRVDASDVLQDAFLDAATYLDTYLRGSDLPPFLWLRCVVSQRLNICYRRHCGTKMRDVAQEVSLYRNPSPQASSAALASMLMGRLTSPSNAAIRAEQVLRVQEAINALEPLDREARPRCGNSMLEQPSTYAGPGHHRGGRREALPTRRPKVESGPGSAAGQL